MLPKMHGVRARAAQIGPGTAVAWGYLLHLIPYTALHFHSSQTVCCHSSHSAATVSDNRSLISSRNDMNLFDSYLLCKDRCFELLPVLALCCLPDGPSRELLDLKLLIAA